MFLSYNADIYFIRVYSVLLLTTCFCCYTFSLKLSKKSQVDKKLDITLTKHNKLVERFYKSHKQWKISVLGSILFKGLKYPDVSKFESQKYTVLYWHNWLYLRRRYKLNFFSPNSSNDLLKGCSVHNCYFTGDENQLYKADAVVVSLNRGIIPPNYVKRKSSQRWIFFSEEPPPLTFLTPHHGISYKKLHNIFNWSMTYRTESDIPVPYGRTVALTHPRFPPNKITLENLVPNWKEKRSRKYLVANLMSRCTEYRLSLTKTLKNYIPVKTFGRCWERTKNKTCPLGTMYSNECKLVKKYLFYLSLENSRCKEYMSEKIFFNAYYEGAIPIIQGPTIEECEKFLPPNSYLHIDNYDTVRELAQDIVKISRSEDLLLSFYEWRNHFEVLNEHGFFGTRSSHLCRVCEALNYNSPAKSVYSQMDLVRYLDEKNLCTDLL